jgi:hypothetical protein
MSRGGGGNGCSAQAGSRAVSVALELVTDLSHTTI